MRTRIEALPAPMRRISLAHFKRAMIDRTDLGMRAGAGQHPRRSSSSGACGEYRLVRIQILRQLNQQYSHHEGGWEQVKRGGSQTGKGPRPLRPGVVHRALPDEGYDPAGGGGALLPICSSMWLKPPLRCTRCSTSGNVRPSSSNVLARMIQRSASASQYRSP